MEQSTQTNNTDIEYVPIYDKPDKPKRGRPSAGSKFTNEEKAERARQPPMNYCFKYIEQKENDNY